MYNEKLHTLNLKGNLIDSDGLIELIDVFKENKGFNLKSFDLSSNRLDVSFEININFIIG